MRVFTVLTTRDPAALSKFAQTVKDIGATGVTIFTRPEFVSPILPPGMESEADLTIKAEEAAKNKDYQTAAQFQKQIEELKAKRADLAREGAQWIADAISPIKEFTQLIVLGTNHWPATEAFTQQAFMAKLEVISNTLLNQGIGGIKQSTPLYQRTFIPLPGAAGGYGAQGEPATGASLSPFETTSLPAAGARTQAMVNATKVPQTQPKNKRHPSLPVQLSEKQSQFASYRLGLDRGGQRRSRNEAGNMMGYSANVAAKVENSINGVWKEFSGIISSSDVLA